MHVFLNGRLLPEEQAVVSVFDRSFLYGDGLFEALCVFNGKPFRWAQHFERLKHGAQYLGIRLQYSSDDLLRFIGELIAHNGARHALLRITLSRGVGVRGYSPKGANSPTLAMSLHSAPELDTRQPSSWKLIAASVRVPANEPLAQFKTCNKLPQIFARSQADQAGADEALVLNSEGAIVEGSSSNLFWLENDIVCTPPLMAGVLPGVTREVVLEICRTLGHATREKSITPEQLRAAQGVFVSLSTIGLAEGISLDAMPLGRSEFVKKLYVAYWNLVQRDTT